MLYRRKNSSFWWVRFTTPDGKEVRRTTGTTDRKAAEEYEASVKLDLWRQEKLGEQPRRSWPEAVVRWLGETEHKASREDDLCHFRWLDPHLGGLMLDAITLPVIDDLAAARKRGGVSNGTTNRTLALVRSVLRRAERRWGWLEKAPAISLLPEPKRRVRWLTREEADRLLVELPEHLAEMARFTLATGLREQNVVALRWDQVDLTQRRAWIHADQAKARRAIAVPLNADAVLVLWRQLGNHQTHVFSYRGHPVTRANNHAWRKALVRAGISDFRWHDLRHTWASWLVQAGVPLHALQELGGWESPDMVRRYAHLSTEHLAEYSSRIETKLSPVPSQQEPFRTVSGTQGPGKKKAAL